jgi:Protein of unknown function (DUF3761)
MWTAIGSRCCSVLTRWGLKQEPAGSGTAPGATAICRDCDYSFNTRHSGTCSGHGRVARQLDVSRVGCRHCGSGVGRMAGVAVWQCRRTRSGGIRLSRNMFRSRLGLTFGHLVSLFRRLNSRFSVLVGRQPVARWCSYPLRCQCHLSYRRGLGYRGSTCRAIDRHPPNGVSDRPPPLFEPSHAPRPPRCSSATQPPE